MKKALFSILIAGLGLQQGCSSCKELRTPTLYTEYGEFHLTITNAASAQFELLIKPFNAIRIGSFLLNEGYERPDKTFPQNQVTFQFFFRENALPGGEDIFEQKKGEVFEIPPTPYEVDGMDVVYKEAFPPPTPDSDGIGWWLPTTYSGKVSILEDDLVEFDLTFTDGVESRRVLATFVFKTLDLVQNVGECG
ncbi:MAG: hypothetical protein U1F66_06265 [bacterium]